jgi:hypothetical protein
MWAHEGSNSSKERLGYQAGKNLPKLKTLHTRPKFADGRTLQRVGYPVHINPHLGGGA